MFGPAALRVQRGVTQSQDIDGLGSAQRGQKGLRNKWSHSLATRVDLGCFLWWITHQVGSASVLIHPIVHWSIQAGHTAENLGQI